MCVIINVHTSLDLFVGYSQYYQESVSHFQISFTMSATKFLKIMPLELNLGPWSFREKLKVYGTYVVRINMYGLKKLSYVTEYTKGTCDTTPISSGRSSMIPNR